LEGGANYASPARAANHETGGSEAEARSGITGHPTEDHGGGDDPGGDSGIDLSALEVETNEDGSPVFRHRSAPGQPGGGDDGDGASLPARLRTRNLSIEDRAAIAYANEHGITITEAARALGEKFAPARPAPEEAPPPADPELERYETEIGSHAAEAKGLEGRIAELVRKRQALRDEGEHPEADEVADEIATTRAALTEARLNQREATRERDGYRKEAESRREAALHRERETAFRQAEARSLDAARDLYPELNDPNSELSRALAGEYEIRLASGDPLLANPDYPKLLAAAMAGEMGKYDD